MEVVRQGANSFADFNRVDAMEPAFADEEFIVFAFRHPDIELVASGRTLRFRG